MPTPSYIADMAPNKRSVDKQRIAIWVPIPMYMRFKKRAESLGMTMTEMMTAFLVQETQNIELTQKEYEEIAKIIAKKTNKS